MSSQQNIFAAIDLGSNSFHMIVGQQEAEQIIILDRLREMVRLASGLDKKNNITPEAMQNGLDCLARFGERIRHLHADVVRIVGTNTLRQARNANTFMNEAENLLGQPIEIISGIEEARLIYKGVAHSVDLDNGRRMVIDIGGGSTEVIIGERFKPLKLESLYMGCVNMTRRFFANGKISHKRLNKARMYALVELEPHVKSFLKKGWNDSIGASGTIRAIEKIAIAEGWAEQGISYDTLEKIINHFIEVEHIDNIELTGLKPERKPVIVGGVIVLRTLFEALKIEHMTVSDQALREGILYDLIGRSENNDVRSETVENLAQRFAVDIEHSQRVEKTAIELLKQLKPKQLGKPKEAEKQLRWAASLHELGLSIAHSQYYRHGAYIIANADLTGFSRQDQKLLAAVIHSHRRTPHLEELDGLDKMHRQMGTALILLLRLAVLLNRNRSDEKSICPGLQINDNRIQLKFPDAWLDEHPLTSSDLEEEQAYLQKADFELVYS